MKLTYIYSLFSILLFAVSYLPLEAQIDSTIFNQLNSDKWYERKDAINSLADLKTEEAIDLIIDKLHDGDARVVKVALKKLGKLKQAQAISHIIELLETNKAPSIRQAAAEELKNFDDPIIIEALITALQDSSWPVRRQAVWSLNNFKNAQIISAVEALVNDPKENKMVKREAESLLKKLKKQP